MVRRVENVSYVSGIGGGNIDKRELQELIGQMNDYVDFDPFIRVYLYKTNIKEFKEAFISEYNKNIEHFKTNYELWKEEENADWEFSGWPKTISDNDIEEMDDGLLINFETYYLDVYGHNIPLPSDYDGLADTINNIKDIDFEYEGILAMYADPKYGERIVYSIGNKDRTDYSFSGGRLKEAIDNAEDD